MEDSLSEERLKVLQQSLGKVLHATPSPFMNWLAPILLKAENGIMVCKYTIRKEMTNPFGILHGGVTAGIIDDLIGATVFTMGLNERYTTINNYIDYFATASEGDEVIAETSIVKKGRTILNLQCEISLPSKKRLIAKGYSNMLNLG
ncbi:PaaI family thioesterase [Pedobacter changchengzhani]|uniref:PaaI family thioesterase n=1 Tax=Pedobacter changchengzhani TaxID=2529274 RepID=A0A4R5MJY5_9SPHI|nr:PaaI family thioesterase [Pedobacter changchengzhani]TDG35940.1 PaaI family thioesterase [Pedobacter changchengzhani]